jgi:hypothetical protein
MIYESEYWKKPLLHMARKFSRLSKPREWTEEEIVQIEKDVFIAFYSIRKLIEAHKLSTKTEKMSLSVKTYPSRGIKVHLFNWHHINSLYDFVTFKSIQKTLWFICNQIIHSYVFVPDIGQEGSFDGILFCSDKERNTHLYELEVSEMIKTLRIVGRDYPYASQVTFNAAKQDYDIIQQ